LDRDAARPRGHAHLEHPRLEASSVSLGWRQGSCPKRRTCVRDDLMAANISGVVARVSASTVTATRSWERRSLRREWDNPDEWGRRFRPQVLPPTRLPICGSVQGASSRARPRIVAGLHVEWDSHLGPTTGFGLLRQGGARAVLRWSWDWRHER